MQKWIGLFLWLGLTLGVGAQELGVRYLALDDAAFEKPDPEAAYWADIASTPIMMMPQMITTPSKFEVSTPTLDVRAVHNGRWMAVAVRWADESPQDRVNLNAFSDAVAMAMPIGEKQTTSPFMGGPGTPIEIINWKAIWQHDVEEGYADITDLYPNMAVARYYGSETHSNYPLQELMQSEEAQLASPAIRLGNPVSQINRTTPVEQLAAIGFTGTLTTQNRQDAKGWGQYTNGYWTVVFTRLLDTGDPQDKALAPGLSHEINFAVWDGASGDVGARKSYSMFTPMILEALP